MSKKRNRLESARSRSGGSARLAPTKPAERDSQSSSVGDSESVAACENAESTESVWSTPKRRVVSLLVFAYLAILIIGPLSNPVASPYLSGPLAQTVSPIHRALFLGHGYRFFGPDPGPSHLLVFKGQRKDGTTFEGKLPDREGQWPRLLYHRWFMLSETLFSENSSLPTDQQFQERLKSYEDRIAECQISGKMKLANELQTERDIETEQYEVSRRRVEILGSALSNELMNQNEAETIEIFIQIRQIPLAEEVASGLKLDDESLLSDLLPIGVADESGFRILSPIDTKQTQELLPESSEDSEELSQ